MSSMRLTLVPLYFFHLGGVSFDIEADNGLDYPDDDSARAAAVAGARSMIAADVLNGTLDLSPRIDVTDEQGTQLFSVAFASAVNRV
jgi:hypothetical protein